jgi:hypothetical protein
MANFFDDSLLPVRGLRGTLKRMSGHQKRSPSVPVVQIARLIIGIIGFGVVMGLRDESQSILVRALIAGCAGAVLGVLVLPVVRKYKA